MAARTVIVYQAGDEVFFSPARSVYGPGDEIAAPFVVESRSGARVPNAKMGYEIDKTEYQGNTSTTTKVTSGSQSADANGLGTVRFKYSGPTGGVVLRVIGKDSDGNPFEDDRPLTITNDARGVGLFGGDTLRQLMVTTDKLAYAPNDTARLTITSPSAENVLVSLERGRIHHYEWVRLGQGDTQVTLAITPDLVPGFTVTFSYFAGGHFITEGLPISVSNRSRLLNVTVKPDRSTYAPGQTAHLLISVTDAMSAAPPATLILRAYDTQISSYELVDATSVAGAFLTPAVRATNASSSLVGIGDWGGRCGGGYMGQAPMMNPGRSVGWFPRLTSDKAGNVSIDLVVPAGTTRIDVFAAGGQSTWGQAEVDLAAA